MLLGLGEACSVPQFPSVSGRTRNPLPGALNQVFTLDRGKRSGVFVEEQSWDPAPQLGWNQLVWGTGLSPALLISSSLQGPGLKPALAEWGRAGVLIQGL